jgi:hypothetical protein
MSRLDIYNSLFTGCAVQPQTTDPWLTISSKDYYDDALALYLSVIKWSAMMQNCMKKQATATRRQRI